LAQSLKDEKFELVERVDKEPFTQEQVDRLAALGQAISDPIRVAMLGMMAVGRECCSIPESGVPEQDRDAGLCVCEFENRFGMGQSKVSYHMKKLKDAGLVREEKRGRWNYYAVDKEAVEALLGEAGEFLLALSGS
jgi:ArsR family transcriptional regulator